MLNNSILYRCSSKFCDKELSAYGLGVTPLLTLIAIHENEGILMRDLAKLGSFDKGTITKVIQKLNEQGYVRIEDNPNNKREKKLFTTDALKAIIGDIYLKRQKWWELLMKDMTTEEIDTFEKLSLKVANNARDYAIELPKSIKIFGFDKLSLNDYPGLSCSTIYVGGCNFRCPYCFSKDLVFLNENSKGINEDEVFDYLNKRKSMIDAVCISGGEPLIQEGLEELLNRLKDLNYLTKVDTNGSYPDRLKDLVDKGLIDYVAMDIKGPLDNYDANVGIEDFDTTNVKRTINYLLKNNVDYEFRTTVCKGLLNDNDFEKIGKLIQGAKNYYLQTFIASNNCIKAGLEACSREEMKRYLSIIGKYIHNSWIR